eukprot:COSAG01_NODE_7699_length_3093_cov_2.049432_2_plen_641_part_01
MLKYPLLPPPGAGEGAAPSHGLGAAAKSRAGGAGRAGGRGGGRGGKRGRRRPEKAWNRGGIWDEMEKRRLERRRAARKKAAAARAVSKLPSLPQGSPAREPADGTGEAQAPEVFDEIAEMQRRSKQRARELFHEADLDGSGALELDEIVALAGRFGHKLNRRQAKAAMKKMDADGSGEVDFEEFYAWWTDGDIASGPEAGLDFLPKGAESSSSPTGGGFMWDQLAAGTEGDDDDADSDSAIDEEITVVPRLERPPNSREELNRSRTGGFDDTLRSFNDDGRLNDTLILSVQCLNESPSQLQRRFDRSVAKKYKQHTGDGGTGKTSERQAFFKMYQRRQEGRLIEASPTRTRVEPAMLQAREPVLLGGFHVARTHKLSATLLREEQRKVGLPLLPEPEQTAHQEQVEKALCWQQTDKVEALRTMLPTVPTTQLREVLERSGWDLEMASDFLLVERNIRHTVAKPTQYAQAVSQHIYKEVALPDSFSGKPEAARGGLFRREAFQEQQLDWDGMRPYELRKHCKRRGKPTDGSKATLIRRLDGTLLEEPDDSAVTATGGAGERDSRAEALKEAAKSGDVAEIESLLSDGVFVDVVDAQGYTPLYIATMYEKEEAVVALLGAGAEVDRENNNGDTPLMAASRDGY